MSSQKIDLIRQALSAAESSLRLARQLLNDIANREGGKELPGGVGVFDGQSMVSETGEKHSVPENYASKSILVVGDTLKLVDEGGNKRFKQIEHVKRHKTAGILTKKDGKWAAVSSEGSYKILSSAVAHFKGDVGDEVLLQLPANNLQSAWAALEKVTKKGSGEKIEEQKIAPKAQEKEPEVESKPEKKDKQQDKVEKTTEKEAKPSASQEKKESRDKKETTSPPKIKEESKQKDEEVVTERTEPEQKEVREPEPLTAETEPKETVTAGSDDEELM
jgi:hypothetical protein